jgi:hypothetical protein
VAAAPFALMGITSDLRAVVAGLVASVMVERAEPVLYWRGASAVD